MWSILPFLSDHWKLSSRPIGADLGNGLFQFHFANEKDLNSALNNQPYHFSQWMVILQKWEPTLDRSFPSQISFWISVQGVPVHLWSVGILESIAKQVGSLENYEVSPTQFRMRVSVNALKPLVLQAIVEFSDGNEIEASLVYEKLRNYCKLCHKLDHVKESCPLSHQRDSKREALPRSSFPTSRRGGDSRGVDSPRTEGRVSGHSPRSRSRNPSPPRIHSRRPRHQTERSRRFKEASGDLRRSSGRTSDLSVPFQARSPSRDNLSPPPRDLRDLRDSLSRKSSASGSARSGDQVSQRGSDPGDRPRGVSTLDRKRKGKVSTSSPISDVPSLRGEVNRLPSSSSRRDAVVHSATEAFETAVVAVREVMSNYSNCADPTESAARRERVRLAEELGEVEATAERMVLSSIPTPAPSYQPEVSLTDDASSSRGRGPVSLRLGPVISTAASLRVKKRTVARKKPGRPPGKRASPKALAGEKSKKQSRMNQPTIPFPRRRLHLESSSGSDLPPTAEKSDSQGVAPSRSGPMDFRNPSKIIL